MFSLGIMICSLTQIQDPGAKPQYKLQEEQLVAYEERRLGFSRFYEAKTAGDKIDRVLRVWKDPTIRPGMYVVDEDFVQYRISLVQLAIDKGLEYFDLTLERLDSNYDINRKA